MAPEEFRIDDLHLTAEERDLYFSLLNEVQVPSGPYVAHRLLGHPDQIQLDMQAEIDLASNGISLSEYKGNHDARAKAMRRGAKDWRLLFQVDTDDDAGMMWGDVGRVYFWIKSADLAERDFENVWPVLQCT